MSIEALLLLWICCAGFGAVIAKAKNRPWTEGAILGGLLGVLGIIIEMCLRAPTPLNAPPQGWYPDPEGSGSQRYWNGKKWSDLPPRSVNRLYPEAIERGNAKPQSKDCPDCAETILAAAKVCKHCGYRFTMPSAPHTSTQRSASETSESVVTQGKPTKLRCHECQHVQMIPQSETTFACEECGARLKRRTPGS